MQNEYGKEIQNIAMQARLRLLRCPRLCCFTLSLGYHTVTVLSPAHRALSLTYAVPHPFTVYSTKCALMQT